LDQIAKPRSDLGVRTASGVVMMLIFGTAIFINGWVFKALLALVALGLLREWARLVAGFVKTAGGRAIWNLCGVGYILFATLTFYILNQFSLQAIFVPLAAIIATDVGAYFAGRTIGGPKIAPKISPSKTWSGLIGGGIGASLVAIFIGIPNLDLPEEIATCDDSVVYALLPQNLTDYATYILLGFVFAIIAQSGDFFESWMKRRAGVKDSGTLIPGHGGLLDRMDGLLAVLFAIGIIGFASGAFWLPA
jgi:phosphatidate cytidylyltransferase